MDFKKHKKIKEGLLQELLDMLDGKIVDELRSKSPKFMKVSIQAKDQESMQEALDKAQSMLPTKEEEEEVESTTDELLKPKDEEDNDDDLERLRELYSKLK